MNMWHFLENSELSVHKLDIISLNPRLAIICFEQMSGENLRKLT